MSFQPSHSSLLSHFEKEDEYTPTELEGMNMSECKEASMLPGQVVAIGIKIDEPSRGLLGV